MKNFKSHQKDEIIPQTSSEENYSNDEMMTEQEEQDWSQGSVDFNETDENSESEDDQLLEHSEQETTNEKVHIKISKSKKENVRFSTISAIHAAAESGKDEDEPAAHQDQKPKKGPLSKEKLKAFQQEQDKTGVVYMSRVPPSMRPVQIKHLLSRFGEVGRIYLAPEDDQRRLKRKRSGGTSRKQYTEGWIEFKDKRMAKLAALTLNNQPMGQKQRQYYSSDLWTLKYLPKFKWIHLAAQMNYERQERVKKAQVEMSQSKKEVEFYLRKVDQSKMLAAIRNKKKYRQDESVEQEPEPVSESLLGPPSKHRHFKQRRVVNDEPEQQMSIKQSLATSAVLNNIFTK